MLHLCPSPERAHTVVPSLCVSQMYSSDYKTEETEKDIERKAETLRARA